MAVNLGFGPLIGMNAPSVGMSQPRRSWQERLFDRFVPASSTSLVGVTGDDKKALVRQGLLQLAAGIQSSPNFGQGITQGLLGGVQGINQGLEDVQTRRLRELQTQNALAGPQEFRSQDLAARAAGFEPGSEGYKRFFRIGGGLEARAVTGAARPVEIVGADGRKRQGFFDPSTRSYSLYDETTQSLRPLAEGESPTQPLGVTGDAPSFGAPGQIQGAYSQFASAFPGTQITSRTRTPARNEAVGGVANSQHLTGTAADFVVPPQQRPAFIAQARQNGFEAIDEGDHVHLELPPNRTMRPVTPGMAVSRSPEEQAFATESAQQAAQLQALPARGQIEAVSAGQKATAEATAKAKVERQQDAITALPAVLNSTQQTIGLLDQALTHPGRTTATGLSATLDPRNYVPGSDASNFQVLLDQIKGQAFLQAFQSLKGSGAITDKEGQAATNAIARLNNTKQGDAAFEASLKELRTIAEKAQKSAIQKASGAPSMTPAQNRGAPQQGGLSPAEQAELDQLRARFGRK